MAKIEAAKEEQELDKARKKADQSAEKTRMAMLEQLQKTLGKDGISFASDSPAFPDVISTGNAPLDRLLTPDIYEKTGKGGVPRGVVAEFYGPYSGGKSSLCLMLAKTVTQAKENVLWLDCENSFVNSWAESQGVDLDRVLKVEQSIGKSGEDFLQALEQSVVKGYFTLAVVDSVAGLVPKGILDSDMNEEARIGALARMMSRALPRMATAAKAGKCTIIFVNQIRQKIGVMYGNPETTPGGEALKFFASLRIRLAQIGSKKERGIVKEGEEIGIRSNIQVVKSRFGRPYRECVLPIYYTSERPKLIELLLDECLVNKVIKCKTKKRDDDSVHYFTLDGIPDLTGVEGLDEFKDRLKAEHVKEMVKRLQDMKIGIDAEIVAFAGGLKSDDPLKDCF